MQRRGRFLLGVVLAIGLLLAITSSASALTLGLNWDGNAHSQTELLNEVQSSGATVYHVPLEYGGSWANDDKLVEEAWKRGVTIIPTIGSSKRFILSSNPQWSTWGAWARAAVERYGINGTFWNGKSNPTPIPAWEVWNEPNLAANNPVRTKAECSAEGLIFHPPTAEEPGTCIQPKAYGQLLGYTASQIQAGSISKTSHGTEVLMGGIATEVGEGFGNFYMNASKTAGTEWTGVAIHPYSFTNGVEQMAAEIAGAHSYIGTKTLWITEIGWPVAGTFPAGEHSTPHIVSEAEQASLLSGAFDWIKAHAATYNIQNVDWYNSRDFGGARWDGYCGLVDQSWDYRPAWYAFQDETGVERTGTQYTAFQADNKELWWARSDGFYAPTYSGMDPVSSPSAAPLAGGGDLMAFQNQLHELWTYSTATGGWVNTKSGMDPGTSPSVASVVAQGFVIAFQNWKHELWLYLTQSNSWINTGLGMLEGTSPSIAANETGGYEVAFQANNNELWYYRSDGFYAPTGLGMDSGTSPGIAASPGGGYDFAFQDWQHNLWTYSTPSGTGGNQKLGMLSGTSPSIAVKRDGSWEIAFQANNGELWYDRSDGFYAPTGLGMDAGTSPSIAVTPEGSYSVAFQDWQHNLWTYSSATGSGTNLKLGMEAGTSPSTTIR